MIVKLPTEIRQKIDQFSGRAWLLPILHDWLVEPKERIFILTGDPGTGKSMILAWLAERVALAAIPKQVIAAHFLQANTRNVTPQAFAQAIANQLTELLPGFGDALTEVLADRVRIESKQTMGTVESGGSVTGNLIRTLIIEDLKDSVAFDRIFVQPLQRLYADDYDRPLLILIDALDEAVADGERGLELVELLSKLDGLPKQVRIIATCRNETRAFIFFETAHRFDLVNDVPDESTDILDFATNWLMRNEGWDENTAKRMAKQIEDAAGGIYLYAYMVLKDVIPDLGSSTYDRQFDLPSGLSGLYSSFLKRELGKDRRIWHKELKPLLGLIAVAQGEGVDRSKLEQLLKRDPSYELEQCRQYLVGDAPEGPFRLFHKSLADFLLEDRKNNVNYRIDAEKMHQLFSAVYEPDTDWDDLDVYSIRYLPYHLAGAGRQPDLERLLLDFNFLQAKLEISNIKDLINDFEYLEQKERRSSTRLVQRALSQSAHALVHDTQQLAGQLVGRLKSLELYELERLVEQAEQWDTSLWLRPLQGALTSPIDPLLQKLELGTALYFYPVALAVDGQCMWAWRNGRMMYWDLESGNEKTIPPSDIIDYASSLAVTPDGKRAVSAHDNLLVVWDEGNDLESYMLPGHSAEVDSVAISEDGKTAVSGSRDRTVRVWDLENGKELATLSGHSHWVNAVGISSDGSYAVSSSRDNTLKIWDLDRSKELATRSKGGKTINTIAITPDNRFVIFNYGSELRLWDIVNNKIKGRLTGHKASISALAIAPNSQIAVSGGGLMDPTIRLWKLSTGEELATLKGHAHEIIALAVSSDDQRVVSVDKDGTVNQWELSAIYEGEGPGISSSFASGVTDIAVTPDGRYVVSSSIDKTLTVWDLAGGGTYLRTLIGHMHFVQAVAVTSVGDLAVSASYDETLRVWKLSSGEEIAAFTGHTHEIRAVAVTPDDQYALSGSGNGELKLWHLLSGQERITLRGSSSEENFVYKVAISPDGRYAISAENDRSMRIWDMSSFKIIGRISHWSSVSNVVVTSDGKRAISTDRKIVISDLATATVLQELENHRGYVRAIAVSPNDKYLFSGSDIGELKLWDLDQGTELLSVAGHKHRVNSVAITHDNKYAISGSDDKRIRVWNIDNGSLECTFTCEEQVTVVESVPSESKLVVAGDYSGRVYFLRLVGD